MRNILKIWYNTSSPVVKMLMAVSVTTILVLGHRTYYAPYARRQRHYRAEEWAQTIIENEEMLHKSENN